MCNRGSKFDKSAELSRPVICHSQYHATENTKQVQSRPPTSLVSFKADQKHVGTETRTVGRLERERTPRVRKFPFNFETTLFVSFETSAGPI